jgi:hypothetical protein
MTQQKAWRDYEEVARYLLNRFAKEFGLEFVEGKQKIQDCGLVLHGKSTRKALQRMATVFLSSSVAVIQRQSRIKAMPVSWRIR